MPFVSMLEENTCRFGVPVTCMLCILLYSFLLSSFFPPPCIGDGVHHDPVSPSTWSLLYTRRPVLFLFYVDYCVHRGSMSWVRLFEIHAEYIFYARLTAMAMC